MSVLTDIVIFILTAYLSVTNSIADKVNDYIIYLSDESMYESEVIDENLAQLPSRFKSIPDILLRSAEYQQAAVSGSAGLTETDTDDPISALVNIYCTFTTSQSIRTTTGTGFFIDPDGIIITNAHVAQFLLLEETDAFGETDCTVRTGSPASARYQAELLYISPAWVQENATAISDAVPMGTGERDYALLYVSKDVAGWPLPAKFPALKIDSDLLQTSVKNDTIVAAGYPAGEFLRGGAGTNLYAVRASTSISELYTFGSNYADVFSIRGSVVGAEGASGGPVVNKEGKVIGMISTKGDDVIDGPGSLRAITMSHINRTIEEETGFSLRENLNGNLPERAKIFAQTVAPFYLQLIEAGAN